ncbi:hypothetical protein GCM10025734_29600 [Kitasatospora paranensis]
MAGVSVTAVYAMDSLFLPCPPGRHGPHRGRRGADHPGDTMSPLSRILARSPVGGPQ